MFTASSTVLTPLPSPSPTCIGKKKGMLMKRKKDRDTWAPRLFELDGETLRYFVKVCWVMVFSDTSRLTH